MLSVRLVDYVKDAGQCEHEHEYDLFHVRTQSMWRPRDTSYDSDLIVHRSLWRNIYRATLALLRSKLNMWDVLWNPFRD